MSHHTFELENIAAMTELNDEEITNLVGGSGYVYDGDLIDLDDLVDLNLDTGDILSNNDVDVLTINPIVGLLGTLLGNKT
ncbi:hypothetical protein I8748_03745 [Nostoc sp. CENA67]|uniref:Uncharacterized protein n=1 Tax=Amazonocrinis nigriterrae CENA67 TaxID=2794033 RepID=A0A8J7HKJ7_9NOST|nr:hypothetical protein [Amazonocrinis nigriterrae]MBH8561296.1 hypothetical protein [Amazonocrinis nigriterrae CENA67]